MSLEELQNALIAKEISPEQAAAACQQAKEHGLVDDLDYARILVRRYSARMQGKRAIAVRLKAHGIQSADIETALQDWTPDMDGLLQLLLVRFDGNTDYKSLQRAGALLYRRGFSQEEIQEALNLYTLSAETSSQEEEDFENF